MHRPILTFILFFVSSIVFAQQKYQSLLWEISGNGLEKTSYLYGTMHVSKKVAFRLDDVFYKALNESDCIALESDPTTWPAFNYEFMLNEYRAYNNLQHDFYSRIFRLDHPKERAIRNSIRMDNGVINSYLYRKNNASDNFEEETYLDMFIFQAGKKNNKEIVALEDLAESRYLVTKAQYNAEKKDLDPWLQKLFAKESPYLIQENLYRDRNLDLLDSIGAGVNTEYYRKNMLFQRNENMVASLVDLIQEKSVFAGVGAAHLPGEKGMINMLRQRGYTVKALTSEQTRYSKTQKIKLDSLFIEPQLTKHSTPDGFITLNTYDRLREFSFGSQKYYLDPDMTNGAYITINRINRFVYLPNESNNITLKDIDDLLYEDIPGNIIEKTKLTTPYPGLSIVNKTKKGEFQKYHIYETPLEIIVIKFAGRSDFVLRHQDSVFNSIQFKEKTETLNVFVAPNKKFQVQFPEYYVSDNINHSGKKLLQGYTNGNYYFLQETPNNDVSYIEEDSFEAKYLHYAFYKDYKLTEDEGSFKRGDYKTYESSATLDSISNKKLFLKTIVKDGSYYQLGYVGDNKTNEVRDYFDSFQLNTIDYSGFKTIVDTSLHFTVNTVTKAPVPNLYEYNDPRRKKYYEESTKETVYTSKSNEQIFIRRTKYHDLQMFHNADSLWKQLEKKVNLKNRYTNFNKKYAITERLKTDADDVKTFRFSYWDSSSAKKVLVKNILKKGVLFELTALTDSIAEPSNFITEFYESFTPLDTLLGEDVLVDKTKLFLDAVRQNDSIVLNAYQLVKFKKHNVNDIISVLKTHKFPKERLDIKSYLTKALITLDLENNLQFIKRLYNDSYSDPQTQVAILKGLLKSNKKRSYNLFLEFMKQDLPLDGIKVNGMFYSYRTKDSLALKKTLFPDILEYTSIEEYKQPIYNLLAKVKDSGLIKTKLYSKYKNQLINDGKIEVKRSLSKNDRYSAYSRNLTTYVKLIFPYRKDKSARDFFEKLLNSEDKHALTTYYILLSKNNETIPQKLIEKTVKDEKTLYLFLEQLHDYRLLNKTALNGITQNDYIKSKLISLTRYGNKKDSLSFLEKRQFKTDKGKNASIYFYKVDKKDDYYGHSEFIQAMAFLTPKNEKDLVVDYYYKTDPSGVKIDEIKTIEDQFAEIINLATYKTRKRLNNGGQGYNDYGY